MSFLGAYAHTLFWAYTVQIMALLTVCPVLLSLGAPLRLAGRVLPPGARRRMVAVRDGRVLRLLTFPAVAPALLAFVPFAIYFTGVYPATLRHPPLYALFHLVLLAVGFLLVCPLSEPAVIPRMFSYPLAIFVAFGTVLLDAFPGIVIRFDQHLIAASYYLALPHPWLMNPLTDQQYGGDALWCVGETIDIPFLAVLVIAWMRAERTETVRVDAYLDAREADGDDDTPWWEGDPDAARMLGRRAAAYGWDEHDPGARPTR
jgi:putative copper resistance protein D